MFGGRISAMKMKKIISSAVSAAIAAAAFATAAGAYVSIPASGNSGLAATNQNWKLVINASYNVDYTKVGSLRFVTKVTDINSYKKDKTAGVYGDTEKAFADFSGCVALSANDWFQYDYSGIVGVAGDNVSAASITASDDGTIVFDADFTGKNITNDAHGWTAVSFSEWGNASSDYSITVISAALYDTNGDLIISFDGNGNCTANAAAQTEAETTAPETTVETTTTTTALETTTTTTTTTTAATTTTTTTTAATTTTTEATTTTTEAVTTTEEVTTEETTEETAEETTEEAEEAVVTEEVTTTTAAETTTTTTTTTEAETAAVTEASEETVQTTAAPAAAAQSSAMTSKSDSLMIVLIAAGVVIVGALVGFVIVAAKRKK